ncbi:hypothetical protein H8R18_00825 [Nanchangia anserum]|uniref:Uncharacterized protein n=1 Tax=Nanchangia anserum TaxID=2692125 RepID=A0A8I0KW95_9ACTO|nr:hypothetical protein [Nanchangia anserum]MBD3689784.1 hypothetical protein [Nanchangia anserum]QOX81959.1 hypothetical protein H8R18_00825 [Nanchangia anserum]
MGKKKASRDSEALMRRLLIENAAPIIKAFAAVITATVLLIHAIATLVG